MYDVCVETLYLKQVRDETLACMDRLNESVKNLQEKMEAVDGRLDGKQYDQMTMLAEEAGKTVTLAADNLQYTADYLQCMSDDLERYLDCRYREEA